MSSYKISDLKGSPGLQVEYTGKKLNLEKFLDKLDIKQFDVLVSEERESNGKIRSGLMIDLKKNLFYSINENFMSAPSFREAGLIKKLSDEKSIEYRSGVQKEKGKVYQTIGYKVYRPQKGKKCFELYKEYMKDAENQPYNVDLHGNLFWFRWEKDIIYASINPLELAKNAKKAYKKLDKRLYKIFDEHLPSYKEVIKKETEKLKEG